MTRNDFMSMVYQEAQNFETRWNKGQRGENPEDWPDEMSEEDWWDQFLSHLMLEGKIES